MAVIPGEGDRHVSDCLHADISALPTEPTLGFTPDRLKVGQK